MKNTKIVFLILSLLSFAATQCMKRQAIDISESFKQLDIVKTISEIKKDRDDLITEQLKQPFHHNIAYQLIFRSNWPMSCDCCFSPKVYLQYKDFKTKNYSCFGLIAIAINNSNQLNIYSQKKDYIFLLRRNGCNLPTSADKEFALLEKWERCAITQKINLLHFLLLPEAPYELINHIISLIFHMEKSLF